MTIADVYVVRHAERADEADTSWLPPPGLHACDAPLTPLGLAQAAEAAAVVATLHAARPFARVVTSPFVRCVQTAAALSVALRLPLVAHPGLGACAKVASDCGGIRHVPLCRDAAVLSAWLPAGVALQAHSPAASADNGDQGDGKDKDDATDDDDAEDDDDFFLASDALAWAHAPHAPALLVTHREGIRALLRQAGVPVPARPGYAAVLHFRVAFAPGDAPAWHLVAHVHRGHDRRARAC